MPRVVHFELAVDDAERAAAFYRNVFGWKVDKWEGPMDYWLITTGNSDERGIDGAFTQRSEGFKNTVNTIDVQALDEHLAQIEAQGGKILMPKSPVPGIGWLAYAEDTEGNVFGMMQMDPTVQDNGLTA
jgi:uncharacterized protein